MAAFEIRVGQGAAHFFAVAETVSVIRAAAAIGRTQSAVSMRLRKLEGILGQPLFERQPRGVLLTARGRQLVPFAQGAVRHA